MSSIAKVDFRLPSPADRSLASPSSGRRAQLAVWAAADPGDWTIEIQLRSVARDRRPISSPAPWVCPRHFIELQALDRGLLWRLCGPRRAAGGGFALAGVRRRQGGLRPRAGRRDPGGLERPRPRLAGRGRSGRDGSPPHRRLPCASIGRAIHAASIPRLPCRSRRPGSGDAAGRLSSAGVMRARSSDWTGWRRFRPAGVATSKPPWAGHSKIQEHPVLQGRA